VPGRKFIRKRPANTLCQERIQDSRTPSRSSSVRQRSTSDTCAPRQHRATAIIAPSDSAAAAARSWAPIDDRDQGREQRQADRDLQRQRQPTRQRAAPLRSPISHVDIPSPPVDPPMLGEGVKREARRESFQTALRRAGSASRIFCRSSGSEMIQSRISSMVRWQPMHQPVLGSIWQTLMHGDGGPLASRRRRSSRRFSRASWRCSRRSSFHLHCDLGHPGLRQRICGGVAAV
jgi:hypothetical protein